MEFQIGDRVMLTGAAWSGRAGPRRGDVVEITRVPELPRLHELCDGYFKDEPWTDFEWAVWNDADDEWGGVVVDPSTPITCPVSQAETKREEHHAQ